jgi:3-deoxy-manno-octulosonate cytidylyltransferase (CMP-KDO synthetase)
MKVVGIIPCRYASSRFPGKPLALINDMPMMWHVYQRCLESGVLDEIYIATDDERIEAVAKRLGLQVVMTYGKHSTGTDRVSEVADIIDSDYYVNIQGDEPLIDPKAIELVVKGIVDCSDALVQASNAYAPLVNPSDIIDTNVVKVITDVDNHALAYSRQPIPYPKSGTATYLRQLGLYAFKKSGLQIFTEKQPQKMENVEGVEMYRLLEHGYRIKMIETMDDSVSVDTVEDLVRVQGMM